jgi:hypothetical protein
VNDALAMGVIERVSHLDRISQRRLCSGGAPYQPLGNRLAFEVLHHEKDKTVLFSDVVYRANVRMVEG